MQLKIVGMPHLPKTHHESNQALHLITASMRLEFNLYSSGSSTYNLPEEAHVRGSNSMKYEPTREVALCISCVRCESVHESCNMQIYGVVYKVCAV